jgi:putative ABC transport system permease protein
MYSEVESLMLIYRQDNPVMYLKLDPLNTDAAMKHIESVWSGIFPDKPFECTFLADRFKEQFGADRNRMIVFSSFTLLALFIACLGLLGLAFFTVERRTREIGVRKVFGASSGRVIMLINRDFVILVAIAIAIALPVSGILMKNWLEDYVYRCDLNALVFLWPAVITIALSMIIVSIQSWKSANANPVDSLRDE